MLHKEIPFLRIVIPLCAGILTGRWFEPAAIAAPVAAFLIIAGFLLSLYYNKSDRNIAFGLTVTAALFFLGLIHYTNEKSRLTDLNAVPSEFICTLSDYPEETEKSIKLEAVMNSIRKEEGFKRIYGSLMLYSQKDTSLFSLVPGDILSVRCTPMKIINRGNPGEFDYSFYMQGRGIRYFAFTRTGDIIRKEGPVNRNLLHRSLIIRQKIISMYRERGITGDTLALVAAFTLGQKNMLDPEQKEYFKKAGVMHIMAVSGLHAVILSYFVFRMLFFLGGRFNIIRVITTLGILWTFAFITGLTPSVLRATLMFSFLQAGTLMKRPVNNINSVLASAFVLILVRPSVIFDAGFQLSYAAVIFIICFYKGMYDLLTLKNRFLDKVWQMAAVTIVAQAGTLPLTIMFFNQFPVWFILSNIIIVPLSSILIIAGSLVLLTFPLEFLSRFIAYSLSELTGFTETITKEFSELPLSVIANIGMSEITSFFLMLTIFLFLSFFLFRNSISVLFPLSALFLFVATGTLSAIAAETKNELIVYNSPGSTSVGLKTGRNLILFTDSLPVCPDVIRHCAAKGLKLKTVVCSGTSVLIRSPGKILICRSADQALLRKENPATIIFTSPVSTSFSAGNKAREIIFASAVNFSKALPSGLIFHGTDTVHYVRRTGAYVSEI